MCLDSPVWKCNISSVRTDVDDNYDYAMQLVYPNRSRCSRSAIYHKMLQITRQHDIFPYKHFALLLTESRGVGDGYLLFSDYYYASPTSFSKHPCFDQFLATLRPDRYIKKGVGVPLWKPHNPALNPSKIFHWALLHHIIVVHHKFWKFNNFQLWSILRAHLGKCYYQSCHIIIICRVACLTPSSSEISSQHG